MKTKILGVLAAMSLAACGGGGGTSAPSSAPSSATQGATVPPTSAPVASAPDTSAPDLELAGRLYKGDARTPAGFEVEARPASVMGTLSTRHLKNTDFATGPQAASPTYEVCTNDMAEAVEWSERMAAWNGQYSDLVEVREDDHMFEVVRVPRADNTAMLRHRAFKCDYLDRSSSDLRLDNGDAGALNQRPLTADELEALAEYLWQFTQFNNADYVVASSTRSASGSQLSHTIRLAQLVRSASGSCDTVQLRDWTHTLDTADGSLMRSLTDVRSFKVKGAGGVAQSCAG
ncbi:MAG TPA: hypothetical protein VF033_07390 [Steroidobacteraceae bacterium]|jgi:hypothetical protein